MKISIISPVYNEEENVKMLYTAITETMDKTNYDFEIIFVNDGSTDSSENVLMELTKDPKVKVVNFRRNYGQTAAIAAGFDKSSGDYIVNIDADLQNDPEDIPKLLEKIEEGYDVVSGWRKNRQDATVSRLLPSKIANFIISKITGVKLHDLGCSLKVYRRVIVDDIKLYGEMHRFIPIYAHLVGGKITELVVNHRKRIHGVTKYGINRTFKVIIDLMTIKFFMGFSTKPNYIFSGIGLSLLGMGTIAFIVTVYRVIYLNSAQATPVIFLMVIFFITGIQFILMGLIAETIMRTHYESQKKPIYYIKSLINFEGEQD